MAGDREAQSQRCQLPGGHRPGKVAGGFSISWEGWAGIWGTLTGSCLDGRLLAAVQRAGCRAGEPLQPWRAEGAGVFVHLLEVGPAKLGGEIKQGAPDREECVTVPERGRMSSVRWSEAAGEPPGGNDGEGAAKFP